ncbi:ABC transporter ATP-binding protein [Anaeromyxobacter oryzae]|uniref:ABC transporter n=1 Tax=Anaeromyxobacter oryzae TaxID=2918170 RepID=A0ABM7WRH4_9BACT|nr:ABC transporter ATP-binding protein [Anaeromyxobacter oryzae]BDG02062.1 ABC transporter [Anaeromyxobacter oryzae]
MTPPACVVELRGVKVERGGVGVLDVPSFQLREREFVSLIGPNGSGKTTLLLSMLALLDRAAGQVLYRGAEIGAGRDAVEARRRMAMVLQEPLLFDTTVQDNVASGLRLRGLGRRETRRRVAEYLERFRLSDLAQRSARKLSGGEARRVNLARALAVEPEVVFLDEPFTSLDLPTRQSITGDLERTIRDAGMAAILVTHDQTEALRLSDRILVMDGGRIVQSDVPSVVMNDPVNAFVASCLGMETIVEGVVRRRDGWEMGIAVGAQEIVAVGEGSLGDRVYCCIRPENVIIDVADPRLTSSVRNAFPARIVGVVSMGPHLEVKLDCGFPLVAHVTRESLAALALAEGKDVFASFKATAIHVIRKG